MLGAAHKKIQENPNHVAIWISPCDGKDPKISRRRYLVNRTTRLLKVTEQARQFIDGARNLMWFVYEHMTPPLDLNAKAGEIYDEFRDPNTGFLILMYHELEPSAID